MGRQAVALGIWGLADAGLLLRVLPAVSSLQILKVVRRLSPEDFQIPVLVQQRCGTDEDEQAQSHDHGPGHFHLLNVGAAPAARDELRSCGHVARHRHRHPHQHHHCTQQEPHAGAGAQGQFGLEGLAFHQVAVACWEANK
ncbi:hypothetical protein EYF80_014060 [Liparis tanakae]|uniref:Uncharacterized protein n=1 Tax=Liparis tanakae TaxID=230148 RepID=A0A4Z2ICS4_9TELE|nr:hypothetical protein EYF80_014060 [Liparis tanakae]